ncbi:MAG: VOC family protein [Thermoplasmatota archaeon]
MSGLIFLGTAMLDRIRDFYITEMGMEIWLEQAECIILKHGNLLIGFCKREEPDTQGIITLFFDDKEEVDRYYSRFSGSSEGPPKYNEKYRIYHFFARDPEGRRLEFQKFMHDIPEI